MSKIKIILITMMIEVAIHISTAEPVSATVATFRADLVTAFTTHILAGNRTEIGNAFVFKYPAEWEARVRSGTTDNTANRQQFAVDKWLDELKVTRTEYLRRQSLDALPTPTPLP